MPGSGPVPTFAEILKKGRSGSTKVMIGASTQLVAPKMQEINKTRIKWPASTPVATQTSSSISTATVSPKTFVLPSFAQPTHTAQTTEAIVHRNAGGNIRHALRDILMLDRAFDLNEIAIIHHTDCGTLTSTDEQIRDHIKARVGEEHWTEVDAIEWGSMTE